MGGPATITTYVAHSRIAATTTAMHFVKSGNSFLTEN